MIEKVVRVRRMLRIKYFSITKVFQFIEKHVPIGEEKNIALVQK
jgi:hypothetical protein